ncbi:hypothetical protein PF005_g33247 [Phytophthora fragariae]|nr:hypothetical protein PF009_g33067 [Phytophthora fragariae]KAE9053854.1 hypothetical protein PF007_g32827 [Phytophthora fragariae]KAE9156352.1 hypothetical protein PF005_g33247 [Phytophthora fragariae]KAE9157968.1 hypothetical protein PF002_g33233 [Phytophthora fragariae]
MDKYDLILGMPWLEKHEPWIDWRGKAIGASRPPRSDRALASHVPTSGSSWGVRKGRQGASASNQFLGVVETDDDFGRAGQGLRVEVPDSTYQVGNLGPHAGNKYRRQQELLGKALLALAWVTKFHARSLRP